MSKAGTSTRVLNFMINIERNFTIRINVRSKKNLKMS